ncbi:MAG TPA: hypothetical protein VE954_11465 [Oligoflexus sp.]|uniref:hypothetical protein n=1 Tax=Oligoflexus sp. TaxID=1971216 RepID=UPI002D635D9E|nr:hypothetical protein [Oligoflexus sp.]HYX33723.1 hypothetical protein [Oligoflexus sp.]
MPKLPIPLLLSFVSTMAFADPSRCPELRSSEDERPQVLDAKAIASCNFRDSEPGLYTVTSGSICLYRGKSDGGADGFALQGSLAYTFQDEQKLLNGVFAVGSTDGVRPGVEEYTRGVSAFFASQLGPMLTVIETNNSFGIPRTVTEARYNFWTNTLKLEKYYQGFLDFNKDSIYSVEFSCNDID